MIFVYFIFVCHPTDSYLKLNSRNSKIAFKKCILIARRSYKRCKNLATNSTDLLKCQIDCKSTNGEYFFNKSHEQSVLAHSCIKISWLKKVMFTWKTQISALSELLLLCFALLCFALIFWSKLLPNSSYDHRVFIWDLRLKMPHNSY